MFSTRYKAKIISLLFFIPILLPAQTWEVPAEKKAVVSPFKFDAATQKEGASLFLKNCVTCHGEPGKNNGAKLNPFPGDPSTEKFRVQTDGDIFYKITNGRGLMPKFSSVLKEEERWKIISYIRTFHEGYIQPEPVLPKAGSKKALDIKVSKLNDTTIDAVAYSLKDSIPVTISNVELALQVQRYFGKLQLGEALTTDANGKSKFTISKNLPADTVGNITLIVSPTNKELYGDAETAITLQMGTKNSLRALNEKRAIWNVVQKAPLWILFTYTMGVIGVWSVIGYIIFQLVKLSKKKKGEQTSAN
jgi:mono/diheme cytochrome c family protein